MTWRVLFEGVTPSLARRRSAMRFDSDGDARDNASVSQPLACDASTRACSYAAVALLPAVPGKDLLTYRVEALESPRLRPGMRVLVPLGRRRETGLVVTLGDAPPPGLTSVRSILEVLDTEPIVTAELFAFCRWAGDYYMTSLADVLAAALPGSLRTSSARVLRLADGAHPGSGRRQLETAVLEHLAAAGAATAQQLERGLARPGIDGAVRALARRGLVVWEEELRAPAGRTRYATLFALVADLASADAAALMRRARRQHAIYERLRAAPGCELDAGTLTPAERVAAQALVRRGLCERRRAERYRNALPQAAAPQPPPELTDEQRVAVDAVTATQGFRVFLLHGVTGSGKTEVYLRLAARVHAAGRGVLFLVPEIALTHQLVLRVQERFGSDVALLHSGLTPGERWDEWRRVARGEARVVVGARSAVFAPLADVGLVIVDEEHDAAYKQDEGLRYNARDLAIVRAKLTGAAAMLGSATPSVESYQQARTGKYQLLSLSQRVEGRPLPAVELIDLRARSARSAPAASEGTAATLFSPPLLEAIDATLKRREQVVLFLNRRGFARALQCLACGEPAGCPSCSVALTLHERRGVLLCHHCGHARQARSACARCGSDALRAQTAGTERIEVDIARFFPHARVGRLDRDTTASKGAHRRILEAWSAGAFDILIGTQMVAKGHDVPAVTLVGVLLADVALNMPDFRAAERAFQLLTQVAGRAGRGDAPGRVLVQTYRPEHHSLVAATTHDYLGFAPRELALREELGYPPFARLVVLRLEGVDLAATERAALDLAARARSIAREAGDAVTVRGPAPAPLERLRNRHRWQLMVSSPRASVLRAVLRALLVQWRATSRARSLRLVVDIDPVSML